MTVPQLGHFGCIPDSIPARYANVGAGEQSYAHFERSAVTGALHDTLFRERHWDEWGFG